MDELRDRIAEAIKEEVKARTGGTMGATEHDLAQAVIDTLRIEEHVTEVHGGNTIRKDYSIGYSEEIHL